MNRLLLSALALGLGFSACKSSDPTPDPDLLQCPSDRSPIRGFGGRGSCIMPNSFSPNGDGKNDQFRLVCSDTGVISALSLRIVDQKGTLIKTIRSQSESWDGYDATKAQYYPSGWYRVDYGIEMAGGTGTASVLNGHTCIKLYGSDSGSFCLKPIGSSNDDVFEDQIDPKTSTAPYTTAEVGCPK